MNENLKDIENNFKNILEKLYHNYEEIEKRESNLNEFENNLEKKRDEINRKESDLEDFKKVSIMSSMSKQIKERDKKITLLEKQLNKYKQQVFEFKKKEKEKQKNEDNDKNNIEDDWKKLSKEIYNLENTIFDTYNEPKSIIPIELLAKGYQIYKDQRNHNNRYWIKTLDNNGNMKNSINCKNDDSKHINDITEVENNIISESNRNEEGLSSEEEEEEILYEETIEGKDYFISESIPKIIYEKLKNDNIGKNIGIINEKGAIIWD